MLSIYDQPGHAAHPIASKIPWPFWATLYGHKISEPLLAHLQGSLAQASGVMKKDPYDNKYSLKAFICLIYGHTDHSEEALLEAAKHMGLEPAIIIQAAAITGKQAFFSVLDELMPQQQADLTTADNYYAFRMAAWNGHLAVMECLIKLAPDEVAAMIQADGYYAFRLAACNGHLAVIEHLIKVAPDKVSAMIAAKNYGAFRLAAQNGHFAVIDYLIKAAPDEVAAMIAADNYYAFGIAAQNGHLAVIGCLIKAAPHKAAAMIAADNYYAFRMAAGNGHLDVIERLIKAAPDEVAAMIEAKDNQAFRMAAEGGHLAAIDCLIKAAPDEAAAIIAANNYYAFRSAALGGHLPVIEYLIKAVPHKIAAMIAADDYGALQWAAHRGHLAVIERLIKAAPHKVSAMIAANEYGAFRLAAQNGHLAVMECLIKVAPDEVVAMIAANNYEAFRNAVKNGHDAVIKRMLQIPKMLSWAEGRDREYGRAHIYPFVSEQLATWREQSRSFVQNNPNGIFNLEPEAQPLGFYIARNLIRRNASALMEDLRFLVSIPGFEALAHGPVGGNQGNELLRLALRVGNQEAAAILLSLPQVYALAVQHIAENNYEAFRNAVKNGHDAVIKRMLQIPKVLAWAEEHDRECDRAHIYPFVSEQLATWREQSRGFVQNNPNGIFNLEPEAQLLGFYIARNLIRRNAPALMEDLRFLVSIPGFEALAHGPVGGNQGNEWGNQGNELLRLALRVGNQEAAAILLSLPQVYALAVQHIAANNYEIFRMTAGNGHLAHLVASF